MLKVNSDGAQLTGTGAAYIRVSTDHQDTERQYKSIHAFESRYGASIPRQHWFEDEGWARDTADHRPEFQRLMKLVETGRVQWIVVDRLDRFGTKKAKQLISYLYRLEEAGCKLYDASGKEWTGEDDATEITALIEGKKSEKEQRDKSYRVLGGKIEKARAGEWQGGPVRLGFDVVCYHRETDKELWRVVLEGRDKRLKVYPDGRTERFDGKRNFPKAQTTEVLRIAPSKDKARIAAAVSVFKRYASESISFTALAQHLDRLGFRNGGGGTFQGPQIEEMLRDPIYLGYYTWNKWHFGKFHRLTKGQTVPELNFDEKGTKNNPEDWVQSRRLFKSLVDQKTWDTVQKKLDRRTKRAKAPRSPAQYLGGLLYCGNCGCRMYAGSNRKPKSKSRKDGSTGERYEYFCSTYFAAVRGVLRDEQGRKIPREECGCLRNGVFQDTLEDFIERYLEETGQRLNLLTEPMDADDLTDRLEQQEDGHWNAFHDGIQRLTGYLARYHPDDYNEILAANELPVEAGGLGTNGFVNALVECYQSNFDPSHLKAEMERLDAQHTALTLQRSKFNMLGAPIA